MKRLKQRQQRQSENRNICPADWSRPRLRSILRGFGGRKILVLGDVGIDRYIMGSVERISPEAPVPIVAVEEEKYKLGLAANVADNVHALGGVAILSGVVGRDRGGDDFRSLLQASGISPAYLITDPSRRTVLKERIVSERQQLLRVDYENVHPIGPRVEAAFLKRVKLLAAKCDAIILEDYAKGMLSRRLAEAIFSIALRARKVVAVDPNLKTSLEMYRGATVLTPNTREAEMLAGFQIRDEASLLEAGHVILRATRARHIVITRGKDGMAIFSSAARAVTLIPTYAREVYDVSGAGDTVISVLALALSTGATIEEASILGNLAAGVEVAKRGTATVSPDEIIAAMDSF